MTHLTRKLLLLAALCLHLMAVRAADSYTWTDSKGGVYECITIGGKYQTETVDGYTSYHVKITRLSQGVRDLVIYNDIGSVYNYRTIFIDHGAFQDNKDLETVTFEDTHDNTAKVHSVMDMSLGNNVFKGCTNLRAIYMKYEVTTNGTDGRNHTVMLKPDVVRPEGTGIFDDCPNLKIYVDAEYYDDYCRDKWWSRYKDKLVATTAMRYSTWSIDGVRYDYDRTKNATYDPATETSSKDGKTRVWPIHATAADDSYLSAGGGRAWLTGDIGQAYAYRTTSVWKKAFYANEGLRRLSIAALNTGATTEYSDISIALGDSCLARCKNLQSVDLVKFRKKGDTAFEALTPSSVTLGQGVFAGDSLLYVRVHPDQVEAFRQAEGWREFGARIIPYTDFGDTYKGVKYGYVYKSGSTSAYYTNNDNDAFYADALATLRAQTTSYDFDLNQLLASTSEASNVRYKTVGGVDDAELDKLGGEMLIVNDFGALYNYRTIALDAHALRGNRHIRSVAFQDLPDNYAADAYYPLRLAIPDGAFEGCANLKVINMHYLVLDGDNHYESLGPENIFIGKDVFQGCDPDYEIRVAPDRLDDFLASPDWARYKDHIRSWEFAPTTASPITLEGVTYDYAATQMNNLPNDKVVKYSYSLLNIPVQVASALAMSAATAGSGAAVGMFLSNTLPTFEALCYEWLKTTALTLGYNYTTMLFANMGFDESVLDLIMLPARAFIEAGADRLFYDSWWMAVATVGLDGAIAAANKTVTSGFNVVARQLAGGATLTDTKGLDMRTLEDENLDNLAGDDYPGDTYLSKALNMFSLFKSKNTYVVYKMFVSKVGDLSSRNGLLCIYNDVGSAYNYRTVTMDADAARGNATIRRVTFKDVNSGSPHTTFMLTLPDRAFEGCTALERFELFMESKDQSRTMALDPTNVIPLGDHVFDGCPNLKIYVAKEKYAAFVADSAWHAYRHLLVAEDWTEKTDFKERGAAYSYNMRANSLVDKRDGVWQLHISSADDDYLKKHDGRLTIVNDPGSVSDYRTTAVKKNAFRANANLRSVDFCDLITVLPLATASATTLDITLADSCFADCKNLKAVYLTYYVTDGFNRHTPLGPDNVKLGAGVFAGHADDFKIYVDIDRMRDFLLDPSWLQYADCLAPVYFTPEDADLRYALDNPGVELYCSILGTPKLTSNNNVKEVKAFDEYAYWELQGLEDIPAGQFAAWAKLARITLPKTVKTIGSEAFAGTQLERITLPKNVAQLGEGLWKGCTKLAAITVEAATPPQCTAQTFEGGMTQDYRIFVHDASLDAYRTAPGWSAVSDHICGLSSQATFFGPTSVEVTTGQYGDLLRHFNMGYTITYDDRADQSGTAVNNYYIAATGDTSAQWAYVDSLKVSGPIDVADLLLISRMGGMEGSLSYLDLSDAQIVAHKFEYKGSEVSQVMYDKSFIAADANHVSAAHAFDLMSKLRTLVMPRQGAVQVASPGIKTLIVGELADGSSFYPSGGQATDVVMLGAPPASGDGEFFSTKNPCALYVPYSSYGAYLTHKYLGQRAASVATAFKDDEAYRAFAAVGCYGESQAAVRDTLPPVLRGNTRVRTLDDFYLFSSLESVPGGFFSGCAGLERVTLPVGVRSIGRGAFEGCSSLESLTVLTDTVPDLAGEDPDSELCTALADLPADFRIYVTDNMLPAFLADAKWHKYRAHFATFQQTDPSYEVTVTAPGQLAAKLGMTQTVAGNEVTEIGAGTCNISSVRKLKVSGPISGADVAVLRYLAGREYQDGLEVDGVQLRELDLADAQIKAGSVDYKRDGINRHITADNVVDQEMFYDCDCLEKLVLPRTATEIGRYALARCAKLATVVVPERVQTIRGYAFEDSPRLKNLVFLGDNLPQNIDTWAFGSEAGVLYNKHYLVDCIFTRRALRSAVASHPTLQQHTLHTAANFADDGLFRALAMHCVLDTASAARVESVDGWFAGNTALRDASMLRTFESLRSLPDGCFRGCTALEKVVAPAGITSIGSRLFDGGAARLRLVDFKAAAGADAPFSRTDGAFEGVPQSALVYLPTGSGEGADGEQNVVVTAGDGTSTCASLALSDAQEVEVPHAFTADRAAVVRTFAQGVKSTVFLPFAIGEEEARRLGEFYAFDGFNAATRTVNFRRVAATEPNTGYLFVPASTELATSGTTAIDVATTRATAPTPGADEFIGVYTPTTIHNQPRAYGYAARSQGSFTQGQFVKVGEGATVAPMRGYLVVNSAADAPARLAAFFDESGAPTGIATITPTPDGSDASDGFNGSLPDFVDVYSTDGTLVRRHAPATHCLDGLGKGIYVVNGKKVALFK